MGKKPAEPRKPTAELISNALSEGFDFLIKRDTFPCPICQQPWVGTPTLWVSEEYGMASVQGYVFFVNDLQSRVFQVLASSQGRWLNAEHILELAYSDKPYGDQPTNPNILKNAIHTIRKNLKETDFEIRNRNRIGYMLSRKKERIEHVDRSPIKKQPTKPKAAARREREIASGSARREASVRGGRSPNPREGSARDR